MPIGQPPIEKRPKYGAATPMDAVMITLMGGQCHGGVTVTRSQFEKLGQAYQFDMGYKEIKAQEAKAAHLRHHEFEVVEWDRRVAEYKEWPSQPRDTRGCRPRDPRQGPYGESEVKRPVLQPFDEKSVVDFYAAGDMVNIFKHAEHDGLRVMAFLAQYLDPGQDPVRFVEDLCVEAGYDCSLSEWSDEDEDEEKE